MLRCPTLCARLPGASPGLLVALVASMAVVEGAHAAVSGHTSSSTFAVATATYEGHRVIDFDMPGQSLADAPWTVSASLAAGGTPQVVADSGLWTTSGVSFLGSTDAGNLGQFTGGDTLTFELGQPHHAFGLYVITGGDVLEADLHLTANGHTVDNGPIGLALTDGQGSHAHFIGLVADSFSDGFTTVTLTSNGSFFFVFAADDVRTASLLPVPEPTGVALGLAGLAAVGLAVRRGAARAD